MKIYKVHTVYIVILGLVLFNSANITIREVLDPTYHVFGDWYIPRALFWYLAVYLWYKFLTTAYKIEIGDNSLISTSLIRKVKLNLKDITAIKEKTLFVDIAFDSSSVSVSTLMDGAGNIANVLRSLTQETVTGESTVRRKTTKQRIMRAILFILLAAYAVYIELQQIALYSK